MGELNMRHSHATHDLYNRILEGNPPEWTWYVQVGTGFSPGCSGLLTHLYDSPALIHFAHVHTSAPVFM